ncbi:MAG: response regulator transcription factor [Acetivibrionales bacterium]
MIKILLVDDEELIRRGLKTIIHRLDRNFRIVCEAADGNEAIKLINSYSPDIVISDIRMPGKDGLDLAKEIYEKYPQIVTVVLSGYDDFNYAKQAIKYKVFEYLLKPVETEELAVLLDKLYGEVKTRVNDRKRKEFLDKHISGKIPLLYEMMKQKDLVLNIKIMNKEKVAKTIDDIFDYMKCDNMDVFHVRQTSLVLMNIIINELTGLSDDKKDELISDMCKEESFNDINTIEGAKISFKRSIFKIVDCLKSMDCASEKKIINKIKIFIKENYEKNISLSTLADEFYLSPCYLSELFKTKTGQNFLEYLTSVRIEKSIELLKDKRLKIYNISKMVGYESTYHYNRLFKKIIGVTPGEYRKKVCG